MRAFVITIDRRASRSRTTDEALIDVDRLNLRFSAGLVRPFAVTAGDEAQTVTQDPAVVVQLATDAADHGHWWVGVGIGDVEEPLPSAVNAARGEAFYLARRAVEAAKNLDAGICVLGDELLDDGIAALSLLAGQRSDVQYETVTLARMGLRQADMAEELLITQQAVSKRLAAAGWEIERRLRRVCLALAGHAVEP